MERQQRNCLMTSSVLSEGSPQALKYGILVCAEWNCPASSTGDNARYDLYISDDRDSMLALLIIHENSLPVKRLLPL